MDFLAVIQPYLPVIKAVVVGAVIGYFTNYIAIKMLFRPRKAWKIGKFRVPLTPGVIPKNQERMANAVSSTIVRELLTEGDIKKVLEGGELKEKIYQMIEEALYEKKVALSSVDFVNDNKDEISKRVSESLSSYIVEEVKKQDLTSLVKNMVEHSSFASLLANPMVKMFLPGDSIYEKIAQGLENYLAGDGKKKIEEVFKIKCSTFIDSPLENSLEKLNVSKENLRDLASLLYDKVVVSNVSSILSIIDIKKIIHDKISLMDVRDLEKLVLDVMKKELSAIVNLGAVLGAVIGLFNLIKI